MASPKLKATILIVSTTAAKDPSTDASEPVLRTVLEEDGGGRWDVVETKIVSDVVADIQRQIMLWADAVDSRVNLVVTTGGTGFAHSDGTPEAVSAILHKQAPGLVQGMLSASLAITPFAMMSRPVAGVRGGTVIVTLPGSPKGAKENLQAIIKTLPHACLQAAGVDSRALHAGGVKKLEAEAGVSGIAAAGASRGHSHSHDHHHNHHHHHHGHGHGGGLVRQTTNNPLSNDPKLGPSRRHRASPYPMVSVDDALAMIERHVPRPQVEEVPVDADLVGAVLAEDVLSAEAVPAFRASIVDGYAVVAASDGRPIRGVFPVVKVSHANPADGSDADEPLKEGQVARITTGAPLPPGATAVVMVEDTILRSTTTEEEDGGREEKEIEILADEGTASTSPGDNVREVGSDLARGVVVMKSGETVTSSGGELGLLASAGVRVVRAYRRPVVAVLSTGDEVVDHARDGPLRRGEVRDANRVALVAAARAAGFPVVDLGIARDEEGKLEVCLRDGLRSGGADVIVTTGGVSMGELDLLKPTVERSLGGTVHFGRVNMKPGKPTTFATVPPPKDGDGQRSGGERVVFGLPGNPASALVTFHLFVLPALHRMAGRKAPEVGLPRVPVALAHDFPLDRSRPEYHRAHVAVRAGAVKGGAGVLLEASSTGGQRSSRVGSLRAANALLCMPTGSAPLAKGSKVDALLMGPIGSLAS